MTKEQRRIKSKKTDEYIIYNTKTKKYWDHWEAEWGSIGWATGFTTKELAQGVLTYLNNEKSLKILKVTNITTRYMSET